MSPARSNQLEGYFRAKPSRPSKQKKPESHEILKAQTLPPTPQNRPGKPPAAPEGPAGLLGLGSCYATGVGDHGCEQLGFKKVTVDDIKSCVTNNKYNY